MNSSSLNSTGFARFLVLLSCGLSAGLGIWSLSGTRDWAEHCADFHVPAAWYAFPVVPPALIALASFAAPKVMLGAQGSWRLLLTVCTACFFALASPLVYVIYGLEARSDAYLNATRNSQHR